MVDIDIDDGLAILTIDRPQARGAKALVTKEAERKRVIRGVSLDEAIASSARLWIADAHWQAAERVMDRTAGARRAAKGAI